MSSASNEILSFTLCEENELQNNQMKQFSTPEGEVLLVKEEGNYYAVGAKCTHYGAPLAKGILAHGHVRCPWHGACFNISTGDIEDYPGLDSLPKFDVEVKDGNVIVHAAKMSLIKHKHVKNISVSCKRSDESVVIIGGGASAETCLETLRQNGYDGQIILLTKEKHLPYDRPKLSKNMDQPTCKIFLRNYQFYEDADIDIRFNKEVVCVDFENKIVKIKTGEEVNYTKLVIATGGRPRELSIPGSNLGNVFYLRNPENASHIVSSSKAKSVVIIGDSFIGMEAAAYLVDKASDIIVVGRNDFPYQNTLGKEIGERLKKFFEEKGVKFETNCSPVEMMGNKSCEITGVKLDSGKLLKCDCCIIGIGVVPETEFLSNSNIKLTKKGFIDVNEHMSTNIKDVYACGDIANFPLFIRNDEKVAIGHWQMAHAHGNVAAHNILNKKMAIKSVPFFWTVFFGKSLRHAGYSAGFDSVVVHGSLEDLSFIVYYCIGEEVVAVSTLGSDPLAAKFADMLLHGHTVCKSHVTNDSSYLENFKFYV